MDKGQQLHDSLRKETKRPPQQQPQAGYKPQGQGHGHGKQEVEFGADGQPVRGGAGGKGADENFLPSKPDVIDVSGAVCGWDGLGQVRLGWARLGCPPLFVDP